MEESEVDLCNEYNLRDETTPRSIRKGGRCVVSTECTGVIIFIISSTALFIKVKCEK